MPNKLSYAARFHRWRLRHLSERKFIILLSVVIGIIVGILATLLKNFVWKLQDLVNLVIAQNEGNSIYFILPIVGILLTVLLCSVCCAEACPAGNPECFTQHLAPKGRSESSQSLQLDGVQCAYG